MVNFVCTEYEANDAFAEPPRRADSQKKIHFRPKLGSRSPPGPLRSTRLDFGGGRQLSPFSAEKARPGGSINPRKTHTHARTENPAPHCIHPNRMLSHRDRGGKISAVWVVLLAARWTVPLYDCRQRSHWRFQGYPSNLLRRSSAVPPPHGAICRYVVCLSVQFPVFCAMGPTALCPQCPCGRKSGHSAVRVLWDQDQFHVRPVSQSASVCALPRVPSDSRAVPPVETALVGPLSTLSCARIVE